MIPNSVYMGMDPPKDGGMPCFSGLICFLLNDDGDDDDDGSEERRVSILNRTQLLWYQLPVTRMPVTNGKAGAWAE